MSRRPLSLFAILCVLKCAVEQASGHGRLLDPPSRSSMWRMGYKTPENYNDMELFCGGLTRQMNNGMKCGICGDPYDVRAPRANEMGGRYYSGIISERYDQEQVIRTTVELTANHKGFFEFHVCRVNGNASLETEECLQQNPLEVVGEGRSEHGGPYRYYVPRPVPGKYVASLRLPEHFSCEHCVFQWTYTAGNNWGQCEDGHEALGCGPQETFRGCADIAISSSGQYEMEDLPGDSFTSTRGFPRFLTTRRPTPELPYIHRTLPPVFSVENVKNEVLTDTIATKKPTRASEKGSCVAAGLYKNVPGMTDWCNQNCFFTPPFCPESHCECP